MNVDHQAERMDYQIFLAGLRPMVGPRSPEGRMIWLATHGLYKGERISIEPKAPKPQEPGGQWAGLQAQMNLF